MTWGREVAHLELSTEDGPAFKPLPVAICALLAPLGSAAPDAWLFVVRVGALGAVVLAAVIAAQLVPRRRLLAAAAAVAGVLATGGFLRYTAGGDAEPLVVAFALGAWHRHRSGSRDQALLLALLAALIRVETWPFVAAYVIGVVGRRRAAAIGAAVLAAWFLPELAGSGELLRSGERASVPNPGAPTTADRPFLASLGVAAELLPLPLAVVAGIPLARLARDRSRALAAHPEAVAIGAGVAWSVLVALMAEAGFSGEARYAMPGVALIAASAGITAARLGGGRLAGAVGLVLVGLVVAGGVREQRPLPEQLEYRDRLVNALDAAIADAGGRDRLRACGRPAVGRYRGTMAAYALELEKRQVRADGQPDAVTLRSRLGPRDPVEPGAPDDGRMLASNAQWTIVGRC